MAPSGPANGSLRLRPPASPRTLTRTVLRPLTRADAPLLTWIADPEVREHLPGAPGTTDALERYTSWVETQMAEGALVALAVTIDDRPVGLVQAWPCDVEARTIEWGIAFDREHWGEGLVQEAGSAFLAFVFEELHVNRVEARTALDNYRANAAIGRLGGTCERVIKAGLADRFTDCYLWSIQRGAS